MEIKNFSKRFSKKLAVDHLNLVIPKGSIFGLLGTNGAGKTTTIRGILGHIHPTEGDIRTLGGNPWRHSNGDKRKIAFASESMHVPGWMTPERAVSFCAAFYPEWNHSLADRLLADFDLRGTATYRYLSKGQKEKIIILLALCQNAELLVMDEPASGLDVTSRHKLLSYILELVCDGEKTVILSSHLLSDLERIVDRIAFMHKGKLIAEGHLDELKGRIREIRLPVRLSQQVGEVFSVLRKEIKEDWVSVLAGDFTEEKFQRFCETNACGDITQQYGYNLEDLFVQMERESDWFCKEREERI